MDGTSRRDGLVGRSRRERLVGRSRADRSRLAELSASGSCNLMATAARTPAIFPACRSHPRHFPCRSVREARAGVDVTISLRPSAFPAKRCSTTLPMARQVLRCWSRRSPTRSRSVHRPAGSGLTFSLGRSRPAPASRSRRACSSTWAPRSPCPIRSIPAVPERGDISFATPEIPIETNTSSIA